MGVVILLTPPLYKCFFGKESTTEMLPHEVFINLGSLHDLLTINKVQEEKYFIGTWRGAFVMDTERASVKEPVRCSAPPPLQAPGCNAPCAPCLGSALSLVALTDHEEQGPLGLLARWI